MTRVPLKLEDLINACYVADDGDSEISDDGQDGQRNHKLTPTPRILFSEDKDIQINSSSSQYKRPVIESGDTTHFKLFGKIPSPKKFNQTNVVGGPTLLPPIVFSNEKVAFNNFSYNIALINRELETVLSLVGREDGSRGGTPDILHTSPTYASIQQINQTPIFAPSSEISSSPVYSQQRSYGSEIEIDDAFLTSETVQAQDQDESYYLTGQESSTILTGQESSNILTGQESSNNTSLIDYEYLSEEYIPKRRPQNKKKSSSVNIQRSNKSLKVKISYKRGRTKKTKVRSKNGCWICRIRHKACPEERPECTQCVRLKLVCDYSPTRPQYMTNPELMAEKLRSIRLVTDASKKLIYQGRITNEPTKN